MDKMYSIKQTAKILGLSTNTLRNWAKDKKIKAVKIPNNSDKTQWFIPSAEIERLQNGGDSNE